MRRSLDDPPFAGRTGRGIRVAVVDSGVAAGHPHVGEVLDAVVIGAGSAADPTHDSAAHAALGQAARAGDPRATSPFDVSDRIGHGTAVAAAIREKAPDVELLSVKVFHRALTTNAEALAEGIARSVALGARLINLSLGTANEAHEALLAAAVADATRHGALVVSASESGGVRWLPGALLDVVGVIADWECARDVVAVDERATDRLRLTTSAFPRPIPGVPKERNLSGVSFAVANATGFLARLCEGRESPRSVADVRRLLTSGLP